MAKAPGHNAYPPLAEPLEARMFFSVGSTYAVPVSPAAVVSEDPGWRFQLNPSGTPQSVGFNDSGWSGVALPHTWDGSTINPGFGDGWYRKTVAVPASYAGKQLYLKFEGASLSATVYVDGVQVGAHAGAFNGFVIDVTNALAPGASHLIAVDVNNNGNANVVPANGGDYTKQGGLYRDVSLVVVNKAHVALTEPAPAGDTSGSALAGAGVYFSNSTVTTTSTAANVTIKTVLDNLATSATSLAVTSYLVDAGGIIRAQQTTAQSLTASQSDASVTQTGTVANPHLWNGRIDPYLYDLYVEVRDASTNQLIDLAHQKVGIRSFNISASSGFFLNGQPYKLVGADVHQDSGLPSANGGAAGWAQTDAQIRSDLDTLLDVGATVIRTAHYPDNQAFYDYCDRVGLMVYTEFGMNNNVTSGTAGSAFLNNAEDQLTEMIRQNYDHPSVFAWGLYNEIGENSTNDAALTALNTIAHNLDASGRYTSGASNQGSQTSGINTIPNIIGRHFYDGWYSNTPENEGPDIDSWHNGNPTDPMGITETGGGGSAYQYAGTVVLPPANPNGDHFHPQNAQSQLEERQYAQSATRSYLWADIIWQMFDMSSSGRNEGDTQGVNDKGLVTRDRVKKDVYYFYKANWNVASRAWDNQKVLYVSDHNWTDREGSGATLGVPVTVYSNLGAPTLTLNGASLGTMSAKVVNGVTIPNTYLMNVTLVAGPNTVAVNRTFGSQSYTDAVVWTYHTAALTGTSFARVNFQPSGTVPGGYVADTGQAFNGTYGWTDTSGNAAANTAGTYSRTAGTTAPFNDARYNTGILLPTNRVWQYALPNGVYDVHVVCADSSTSAMVNNMTLNGFTLQDADEDSVDEFYARVNVVNGRLALAWAPGASGGRISYIDVNAVAGDAVAPVVGGVTVNGGAAQRSSIQSLSIQFSEAVTLQPGAITLTLRGAGTVYGIIASNPAGDGRTYVLSLVGGASLATLGDGVYDLTVDRTKVAGGTNPMAADYTFTFHRLFGDANGDRVVDAADVIQFNLAKGSTSAAFNYKSYFDWDRDGDIDAIDALHFNQHVGQTLTY